MSSGSAWLRQQFEVLLGAYGWPEKPGEFSAWETWLAEFPQWALGKVVHEAPDRWPGKFPNVGELRQVVNALIRSRQDKQAHTEEPAQMTAGDHIHIAFAKLAAEWEEESKAGGWDPEQCPAAVGTRRIKELQKLWNKHATFGSGAQIKPGQLPRKKELAS